MKEAQAAAPSRAEAPTTTKEDALQHATALFAYALRDLGFNHPFSRDLRVWLVRHWQNKGQAAIVAEQRAFTAERKDEAQQKATTPKQAAPLQRFQHPGRVTTETGSVNKPEPKRQAPQPLKKADLTKAVKQAAAPKAVNPIQPQQQKPSPPVVADNAEGLNPEPNVRVVNFKAADGRTPETLRLNYETYNAALDAVFGLSPEDKATAAVMSPATIAKQYGEQRINEALKDYGVDVEDPENAPLSLSQKAALLKRKIKENPPTK